jgi:isopropylmalate/homocitrate/citramalate synthase
VAIVNCLSADVAPFDRISYAHGFVASGLPPILVCDVGPRDGLQNEPVALLPEVRAKLVDRLAEAGLRRIEAASFVSAARVPQMANAEAVVAGSMRSGFECAGLVLNERGYDRALAAGVGRVHFAFACTDAFNRTNSNATVEEGVAAAEVIVRRARLDGVGASVTIGAAFGCPFEGRVDPGRVLEIAERLDAAAADEIVFADTIGVGAPRQVTRLVGGSSAFAARIGVHLHNTRNTGYANAYAAVEAGASVLDASVGGVGGCPFAPRATGNIATEDLVYLLEGNGVPTGIDLDSLLHVVEWLGEVLGRELPGQLARAGLFPPARPTVAA